MKRILLLIMILILAISMTACGSNAQPGNNAALESIKSINGGDSQNEQQEDEKVRLSDLEEKEREFVYDYGSLMLTWFTNKAQTTKWLSLESVWEDSEGNLYIHLSYKDDSVLIKIKDISEEGYTACDAYFDLPDDASAVPLDTKAITKYLSGVR